jgi:hypothetical protein
LGEFRHVKLRIESAVPSPPAKITTNTWVIRVLDAAGAPITPAELKGFVAPNGQIDPIMPDHNHGSGGGPRVVANGDGTYTVSDLSFVTMPGVWRMTFEVRTAGGQTDFVAFYSCVQG